VESHFIQDEAGTDTLAQQEVACKGIAKIQLQRINGEIFAVHHIPDGDKCFVYAAMHPFFASLIKCR